MDEYNPAHIESYYGKYFITQSGSRYCVTEEGTFGGRASSEGLIVELIAGVDETQERVASVSLGSKTHLDNFIQEHGLKPQPGLRLIVSFKLGDPKQRYGVFTSIIDRIE